MKIDRNSRIAKKLWGGAFWLLPKDTLPEGERPYRDSFESPDRYLKKEAGEIDEEWLSSYISLTISGILKGFC